MGLAAMRSNVREGGAMIFWRGYGILVAVIAFLGLFGARWIAESMWGTPLPVDRRKLCELVGMLVAALVVYGLHRAIVRANPPRTFVDKKTGEEVVWVPKHDLFFVPIKYWPYVLAALGVMFALQG
ncbi:MAG: hypothetical protein QM766_15760 [Burkholderiaceae bacterium]